VADVIALPRPTRTDRDSELDLPPCDRQWPGQCRPDSPAHRCWTWTGWPHVCRCTRCEVSRS
jgi:hypothetical protein